MEQELLDSKLSKLKLDSRLKKIKDKTGLIIQSLLFPKKEYDVTKAKKWAVKHGFKTKMVEGKKDNFIHLQQKKPGRFNTFKTILLENNVKARVAGNMTGKFSGHIILKGLSKFSAEKLKSDLDITIPMKAELRFLCEGSNKDGIIKREELESCLEEWNEIPIIDWHDLDDMTCATKHKISDRVGYLKNPRLENIKGKFWIIADADIINRKLAYHIYLKEKTGKPYELSPEYGWNNYYINGQKHQINIKPHLVSIVDKGHLEGNKLGIKAS